MISRLQEFSFGFLWVGVWSFIFWVYPQLVCQILRIKTPTVKRLQWMRITGALGLIWVFVSAAVTLVFGFFSH